MKKKTTIIALLFLIALSFSLSACSSTSNPYEYKSDAGYEMTHLDVTVDASAGDRSMRITEKFTFEFYKSSHGFYRDFALNSGEKIRDIELSDFSDFHDSYDIEHESSDILRVYVGSSLYGVKLSDKDSARHYPLKCTISYTMITPPHADYPDALVINAIGQGFSCDIDSADVRVILPAATDETPRYYYGKWGEAKDAALSLVSEKPVAGKKEYSFSVGHLDPYNGLTLYYYMPKGSFGKYVDNSVWYVLIGGVLLVGLAVILKLLFGKSPAITPITNYYPPKHPDAGEHDIPIDPVDMGYLIDNTCQGTDVTSLIFYFASLGYLEIYESPEAEDIEEAKAKGETTDVTLPKKSSPDDMVLKKVCDLPDGLPDYQYTLFNKIFSSGKRVTVGDISDKTYTAVAATQRSVKAKYKGKFYDKKARAASIVTCVLTVIFAMLAICLSSLRVNRRYFNWGGLAAIVPIVVSNLFGLFLVYNRLKLRPSQRTALLVIFAVVTAACSAVLLLMTYRDVMGWAESIVLIVAVAASCFIAPFIARRTDYYTRELDEITGFKDFLETAERERLETLLESNPQYYYDVLPYANVLGVSDVWQKKFESLTVPPPAYYRSPSMFDIIVFNGFYRRSFRTLSVATVSRPQASSSSHSGGGFHFGGGGGGGGFSGGGFGGGGGGRW